MSGEDLDTVVDIDGVIIGFVSSSGDEGDEHEDAYQGDLAVYDANYDFIGPARNLRVAEQLLRKNRIELTPPSEHATTRRYSHSF